MESLDENHCRACGIGLAGFVILFLLFVAFMFLPGCGGGYGEGGITAPPSATPSSTVIIQPNGMVVTGTVI